MDTLFVAFDSVEDPRMDRKKAYPLREILFLILCAVICGVGSWCGVEEFGNDRLEWLRTYYPYENGIPSHDTIGRVMSLIKPTALVKAYTQFMASLFNKPEEDLIALDGKTLRRSFDKASGQKPLHILNAWAVKSGLALGHLAVGKKTNEIMAVPELLDLIDVSHATITTDALNTQKGIAEKIVAKKADYVLPVKGNHKTLREGLEQEFMTQNEDRDNPEAYKQTVEKMHGRIETRTYRLLTTFEESLKHGWAGLKAIGMVTSDVIDRDKTRSETRYFIVSFSSMDKFSTAVRGHWGIENSLHWVLDVTFGEDDCRVRKDHAPANFSLIRKLALNLLKKENSRKISLPIKQAKASRSPQYLDTILHVEKF